MGRGLLMSVGLGAVAVALVAVSGTFYYERPTVLKLSVSSADVADLDLFTAAGKLLRHGHHAIRIKVVPTDGIASAAAALDDHRADLAVVRADVAMPSSGETVVLMHKDVALLVAPGGSAVEKIGDLAGKRIGTLSHRPGDSQLLQAALSQYDIDSASVTIVPLTASAVSQAIRDKTVDAIFVVGMPSEGLVPETVRAVAKAGNGAPVFLPVAEAAAIAQRTPAYESMEIVRGAFGGTPPRPADEFDTLGVTYRLVASQDLSAGVVADVTRFLLTERVALAQIAPSAQHMEAPSTDKGGAVPVHPGSAAFIDDEEETFLDRYSDFIYIGAMMLGVVASGLTAVVGRLNASGSVRVEDLVAQLLDLYRRVRAAQTVGALDGLEEELDVIVTMALDERFMRGLDERRVSTLALAVEQVRSGLRDRRETLRRNGLFPANDAAAARLDGPAFLSLKAVGDAPGVPES